MSARLPHLETFARAAELTSFTAAARSLRLSQAAVSQRIHALEKALGTPLFARQGGGVQLTDAGRTLYDYAQRILALHQEAHREITGHDPPLTGELSLAASSVPGEHLLPMLLAGFGQRHPLIRVKATVGDSASVTARVERGEASVGLVGRTTDNPHLQFTHLARDRMVLIVPPGHPLAARKSVTITQLCRHPVVLREAGSGLRHCFGKALERAGRSLTDLQITLELGSNEGIKEAVLRGLGVAILSAFAVQKELDAGTLHSLAVRDLHCDRDLYIVQDRRRVLPLPARLFLHHLDTHPVAP